ncbi:MAG: phosphoribosyl-ATP diphosphatase [Clostridiaceae bacterium]|jgi:phosphoribosyl-ATP pyrophosphohydrolase|nr:phosphoribosyl-ATP diphosphatase [Clostridiaceae bacterium]
MTPRHDAILEELYDLVLERARQPEAGSYTNYLLDKGLDKILSKLGNQAIEVAIAAKNGRKSDIIHESADLVYHLIVLLAASNIPLEELIAELRQRRTFSETNNS